MLSCFREAVNCLLRMLHIPDDIYLGRKNQLIQDPLNEINPNWIRKRRKVMRRKPSSSSKSHVSLLINVERGRTGKWV